MTSPSKREGAVRRRATTLLLGLAAALLAVLCATPSPAASSAPE